MHSLITKIGVIFEKLRANKRIQIALGVLPGVFCFIFTSAFLLDTLNIYATLSLNNNAVEETKREGLLLEVVPYNDLLNYVKTVDNITTSTHNTDGFICTIEVSPFGYAYHTTNQLVEIPNVDFIYHDADTNKYFINGNEEGIDAPDDLVLCTVNLKEDKFYVSYADKEEELTDNINFTLIDEDTVEINTQYAVPILSNAGVYFTTCLEDSKVYYDGIEGTYLQNVNADFLKNFLLGTNVIPFGAIIILYLTALVYSHDRYKLEYFLSKPVITVNIVGLATMVIGVVIAIILLG